jgi:hypothetical protein
MSNKRDRYNQVLQAWVVLAVHKNEEVIFDLSPRFWEYTRA